ncbi:MAG: winged helix-turn-helix domain-containing protein [Terracidiphilus sp.]
MQSEFWVNGWLVRPQANSLEKGGKVCHLEPKIMQVLVELATHPNEVLSKDRLLESLWQDTFVSDDALVRCISEIRSVFGDDPRSPQVIQTIPKSGYRLVASVTGVGGGGQPDASQKRPHHLLAVEDPAASTAGDGEASGVLTDLEHDRSDTRDAEHVAGSKSLGGGLHIPSSVTSGSERSSKADIDRKGVSTRGWIFSTAILILLLIGGAVSAYLWKAAQRSAVDSFWEPLLATRQPVLVCLADQLQNNQITLRDANDPRRMIPLQVNLPSVVLDDLQPLIRVTGILQAHNKAYQLKGEGSINLNDLRAGPVVLIGAWDNAWTLHLTNRLRFRFWNDAAFTRQQIIDSSNPGQTKWLTDRSVQQAASSYRDYAIVARFFDDDTGNWVVVIAGIGSGATIAAGEFVTDPKQLTELIQAARSAGGKQNMEIVLSTEVIDGHPGSSKVEATYFW